MLLKPNTLDPLGAVQSRVAMAAMTRGFADTNHCATTDMVTWGRRILSNPDFCQKIGAGDTLQDFDPAQLKTLE